MREKRGGAWLPWCVFLEGEGGRNHNVLFENTQNSKKKSEKFELLWVENESKKQCKNEKKISK